MTNKRETDPTDRAATRSVDAQVAALMAQMTLAEKLGQMAQVEKNSVTPDEVAAHALGSVLSGGGGNPTPNSPRDWAAMVRGFEEAALTSRLGIPILYGVDAVHGHNNVHGATIFPHNSGLGATGDPDLVARCGRVTARELVATNVRWDFAPAVSVPQDIRWGRTYEGFSADTALVAELGAAAVRGLQGDSLADPHAVLASVKHFVGDGGTTWGSASPYAWIPGWWQSPDSDRWNIDQGRTEGEEAALRARHLPPYAAAIAAGARNIMVSYSSWNGVKMHANRTLLTDVLKGELAFDGFLVSDWMGVNQIEADFKRALITAINAGLDMVMIPFDHATFLRTLREAVEDGGVPLSRIDDAVRRILTVKVEMALFENPCGDEALLDAVGGDAHRAVAREAVRRSLCLLQARDGWEPLPRHLPHLLLAGAAADDIGLQCGGWTIEWQGAAGAITPGTTLRQAIAQSVAPDTTLHYEVGGVFDGVERAPVGIVVLHEPPSAEGEGDRGDLALSDDDLALVERVRGHCDRLVVLLYSGRPLILDRVLPLADTIIAAWLPGTEGAGMTDVLFGDFPFTGRLPYTWPRTMAQVPTVPAGQSPLWPLGHGLS